MKMYIHKKMMAVDLVFLFALASFAQEGDKNVKQKIVDKRGNVAMITFHERSAYKNSNYREVFKDQLALKDESDFKKIDSRTDQDGLLHEKYQLFHKGIKVEFTTYTLHSKKSKLISMNGEFYSLENINTSPKISKGQAFNNALNQIAAKEYLWENPADAAIFNYKKPEGELVLLPIFDGENGGKGHLKLAYKFDIYATNPVSRGDIYIDAMNGDVLFYNSIIKHLGEFTHGKSTPENLLLKPNSILVAANATSRYSNSQTIQTTSNGSAFTLTESTLGKIINTYNLRKDTKYSNAVYFTDTDNNWIEYNNANKDNGALDAHWGAEKTYDYWKTVHGRNSYNNAGAAIDSYVHYSTAYNNAYWNGSVMTYGDGSGVGGFDILTSIDVCAHEIGHGVCSSTANLAYQMESGALNEALSDIWGVCVESFAASNDPNKNIWLIGEQIEMRTGHIAIRSMKNPNSEGQPDTYGGTFWKTQTCTPTSANDYCGVHTNSGVLNHWFYVLTEGESGTNDIGNTYAVKGIGIDKAAKIAFRMESVYMTANSNYANARTYAIQAATYLFPDLNGAPSQEVISTMNAFYAVGVGPAYVGPGDSQVPSAVKDLVASGTTQTTTNLSWTASTDNVGVTGYYVYQGSTQIATVTGTSYPVTGLIPVTTYAFTVKAKDGAGNLSDPGNVASVTTLANSVTYCDSKGNNTASHRIGKVVFNTISNPSTGIGTGTAGYEDFTALSTSVARGKSYSITITPTRTSSSSSEGYAVFIDYNGDGDFTDTGEKVWTRSATSSSSVSGTFTIRTTAKLGATRMRVSMKYNSVPSACETFANGQVEDYTVIIAVTAPLEPITVVNTANDNLEVILSPNPVDDYLIVTLSTNKPMIYSIINQMQQQLKTGELSGDGIDVNELRSGLYFLRVSDNQQTVTKRFIKR